RSAGHVQGRQHLALKALAHLVTIAVPPDHERIAVRRTAAAIDRALRNARLIFVQDFWHTTRIPASLARRTMSAVPRPPGNASTRSGLPSSSICWLRLGPPERTSRSKRSHTWSRSPSLPITNGLPYGQSPPGKD